jgi:hypothetical protein
MSDPFDSLVEDNTDDQYLNRAEFFLNLKEKTGASVKAIAKDEVKALLKSKGVSTAKLRKSLGGKMEKPKDIPGFKAKPKIKKLDTPKITKGETVKADSATSMKDLKISLKKALTKKVKAQKV